MVAVCVRLCVRGEDGLLASVTLSQCDYKLPRDWGRVCGVISIGQQTSGMVFG